MKRKRPLKPVTPTKVFYGLSSIQGLGGLPIEKKHGRYVKAVGKDNIYVSSYVPPNSPKGTIPHTIEIGLTLEPGPQGDRGYQGNPGRDGTGGPSMIKLFNNATVSAAGFVESIVLVEIERPLSPSKGTIYFDGKNLWVYAASGWKNITEKTNG